MTLNTILSSHPIDSEYSGTVTIPKINKPTTNKLLTLVDSKLLSVPDQPEQLLLDFGEDN